MSETKNGAFKCGRPSKEEMERRRAQHVAVPDTIAEDNARARELGLSYGYYMAYKQMGYLPTYIKHYKRMQREHGKNVNIILSNVIGSI